MYDKSFPSQLMAFESMWMVTTTISGLLSDVFNWLGLGLL